LVVAGIYIYTHMYIYVCMYIYIYMYIYSSALFAAKVEKEKADAEAAG